MWTQEYRTPLMSACIHGKTNVVELLLKLKVEPDRLSWKVAREQGHTEITDMFADTWDEVNLWESEEQTLKEKKKNGNCFNKCLII
jgi:ankyrin repeat protein